MKHYFKTHSDIAYQFINSEFDGSRKYCRNAFTKGATFYSYLTAVAQRVNLGVLIDSTFYSATTLKQTREIEAFAERKGLPVIHCGIINPKSTQDHRQNNCEIMDRICEARQKYQRARSDNSRDWWQAKLEEGRRELALYNKIFGIESLN